MPLKLKSAVSVPGAFMKVAGLRMPTKLIDFYLLNY